MKKDTYPRLSRLIDIADLPDNKKEFPDNYDEGYIASKVWEYYEEDKETDINPVNYRVRDSGEEKTIRSTLGVTSEGFIETSDVKKDDRFFSEYDFDVIKDVGIDTDKLWNGEVSDVTYNSGLIRIAETDYFSTAPFTRMLSMEIADTEDDRKSSEQTPLRDKYLRTGEQFKNPARPVSATSGGVIIANKGQDEWVLILGKRSEKTDVNHGMISIFPNGTVEHEDVSSNFSLTVKREFCEEIFSENPKGDIYFDKHISSTDVTSGWNLRSGSLTVGHALMINTRTAYEVLKEVSEHNEEVEEMIEIPVEDLDRIVESINLRNTSGCAVATICESLRQMDRSDNYPSLPYEIDRI